MMRELEILFEKNFGEIKEIKKLEGGGSSREYFRITGVKESVVGVKGNDIKENETFIHLANYLTDCQLNVPKVLAVSEGEKCYLLEDLGDISLFKKLDSEERMSLAKAALTELLKFQFLPESGWKNIVAFPPFSERLVRWDLNYFKYDFLKPAKIDFDEEKLEDDFDRLVRHFTDSGMTLGLMYRDFQSRNIIVKDNKLYFIDFQGARKGPIVYDAVSFIYQAKAPFTSGERQELEDFYIDNAEKEEKASLRQQMQLMKVFRNLQVLGAYGFRGLIEKKPHFLESLPLSIQNLKQLASQGLLNDYPELQRIAQSMDPAKFTFVSEEPGKLMVSVFSFSYKKGYPTDHSGNGGGFMFDCRAIHNPGRYERYKSLNGKDNEVIEFIQQTDEARDFIENAIKIVSPSIERYLKRGFTSLQVGFGCTGGQHRSVYCAQNFAEKIKRKYPEVIIRINHREQQIVEEL